MHFAGSAEFIASRDKVWNFLIDPTQFGACSPAPITRIDNRHYRAQARVGSGLFSARSQSGQSGRIVGTALSVAECGASAV